MAVSLFLSGCAKEELRQEEAVKPVVTETTEASSFESGIALIKISGEMSSLVGGDLADGKVVTKSMGLNQAVDELGVVSIERLFPDAGEFEPRTKASGLDRWYKVVYDAGATLTKASSQLGGVSGVEIVEGQRKLKTDAFNDPMFDKQWHYYNTDVDGSGQKTGIDINVQPVWDEYTTGSSSVIVGVVDGGIQLDHEDLAANCIAGGPNGSKNFCTNSFAITAHEHGTHVAGTISAINNNGKGLCGIAGGNAASNVKGVKLLSCQIFQTSGSGGSSAAAIKWAADHGAVIINNSWGYDYSGGDNKFTEEEKQAQLKGTVEGADKDAIDYFIKYAGCDNSGNQLTSSPMKGGVVIFAAGNEALANGVPANYDAVIAVGSISRSGLRSSFSNYGDWVDICAPGDAIASTVPTNAYGFMSGTSMACPHVSGVAALAVSYWGGQGFTNEMLKTKLLKGSNTTKVSSSAKIGGLVDALGAVTYGSSDYPKAVSDYQTTVKANNVAMSWNVTSTQKGKKTYGYLLFASKSKEAFDNLNPRNPGSGFVYKAVETPSSVSVGGSMKATLKGLDFSSDYYVAICGYDYSMNCSALSSVKKITTGVNNPPQITRTDTQETTLHAYQSNIYNWTIKDPDEHSYTFTFDGGSSAATFALLKSDADAGDTYALKIVATEADPGTYEAKITAVDEFKATTVEKFSYTILENMAPVKIKDFDNVMSNVTGYKFTYDIAEYFNDPDGETLKFTYVMDNKNVLNINQSENTLYATTLGYGLADITVTGTDAKGLSVSSTFKVLVRDSNVAMEAYPNPVVDKLNIRTGEEMAETSVKITSAVGAVVYDGSSSFSAFEPLSVDLSFVAPGKYSLEVTYGGKTYTQKIIKK